MRELKIGRLEDNDIILNNDQGVSRYHAKLIIENEEDVYILDNNSTNGVYVNGTRINGKVKLSPNDFIKIGNSVIPWKKHIIKKAESNPIEKKESAELKINTHENNESAITNVIDDSKAKERKEFKQIFIVILIIVLIVIGLFILMS
jgi:pSer/pThr/pTyr-binding forkhead associated (FHA) protein